VKLSAKEIDMNFKECNFPVLIWSVKDNIGIRVGTEWIETFMDMAKGYHITGDPEHEVCGYGMHILEVGRTVCQTVDIKDETPVDEVIEYVKNLPDGTKIVTSAHEDNMVTIRVYVKADKGIKQLCYMHSNPNASLSVELY
jgi:hypothetical protein